MPGESTPKSVFGMKEELSIVIPVYNEARNIKRVLDGINKGVGGIRCAAYVVYFLDNDNTLPVLQKIKNSYDFRISILKSSYGRGAANQIKTGISRSRGDIILVTMSDLSDDPRDIKGMYKMINQGYDVVCASRYMKGGGQVTMNSKSVVKKSLSRFVGLSLHYLKGIPTHDVTNSYRMYNRRIFKRMRIESDAGFSMAMEVTVKAHAMGYKVTEVPTVWTDRSEGKSGFRLLNWAGSYLKWYIYAFTH
jgi:glycosyltransferase involved in cell wall biosynthesis